MNFADMLRFWRRFACDACIELRRVENTCLAQVNESIVHPLVKKVTTNDVPVALLNEGRLKIWGKKNDKWAKPRCRHYRSSLINKVFSIHVEYSLWLLEQPISKVPVRSPALDAKTCRWAQAHPRINLFMSLLATELQYHLNTISMWQARSPHWATWTLSRATRQLFAAFSGRLTIVTTMASLLSAILPSTVLKVAIHFQALQCSRANTYAFPVDGQNGQCQLYCVLRRTDQI